jgi:hypothetical protein
MGGLLYYSLTAVPSLFDTAKYRVQELTMLLWGMKKLLCGKKEKDRDKK